MAFAIPTSLHDVQRRVALRRTSPAKRPRTTMAAWTRRQLLHNIALSAPPLLGAHPAGARGKSASESTVFRVYSSKESAVTLEPVYRDDALSQLARCNCALLGVANGSVRDHLLAAAVLRDLAERSTRPVTLGLECIESRFQPAVDAYLARRLSEEALFEACDWESRWGWPYEATALPLLRAARAAGANVLALGVPAELLARARAAGGLHNLTDVEMAAVFPRPDDFAAMSKSANFRAYVRECVTPSYAAHARYGLSSSFEKFYTARVVADEAMAAALMRRINADTTTMVAVMGKEHIKFSYGVQARLVRNLGDEATVCSVLLNARAEDAFDRNVGALKLELDEGGVLISDLLWFSTPEETGRKAAKRSRNLFRFLPPVERLVTPESVVQNTST